jgi:hypothetical protein
MARCDLRKSRFSKSLGCIEYRTAQWAEEGGALHNIQYAVLKVLRPFTKLFCYCGRPYLVSRPREHFERSSVRQRSLKRRLACEYPNVISFERLQLWRRRHVVLAVKIGHRIARLRSPSATIAHFFGREYAENNLA